MMTALGAGYVVGGAALLALIWSLFAYFGPGPAARQGPSTDVVFHARSSVSQIAQGLKEAGLIRSETLFVLVAKVTGAGRHLKAGEYDFTSRASMAQILDAIREDRVVRHFVTVPEGVTLSVGEDCWVLLEHNKGKHWSASLIEHEG